MTSGPPVLLIYWISHESQGRGQAKGRPNNTGLAEQEARTWIAFSVFGISTLEVILRIARIDEADLLDVKDRGIVTVKQRKDIRSSQQKMIYGPFSGLNGPVRI